MLAKLDSLIEHWREWWWFQLIDPIIPCATTVGKHFFKGGVAGSHQVSYWAFLGTKGQPHCADLASRPRNLASNDFHCPLPPAKFPRERSMRWRTPSAPDGLAEI